MDNSSGDRLVDKDRSGRMPHSPLSIQLGRPGRDNNSEVMEAK